MCEREKQAPNFLARSAISALVCLVLQAGRDVLLRHGSQVRILPRSPNFTLHIQDVVLDLKWKLVCVTIGTPASVREPVNAAVLVAIEDLVAGFARNPKLTAQFRHGFTRQPPSHKLQSFIHNRTLLPRHCTSSPELVVSSEK